MIYRELHGYKYELLEEVQVPSLEDFEIDTAYIVLKDGILTIKKRYAWDGPSGPTFDTKTFMKGSLVHDALYQLIREGLLSAEYRKYADEQLRDICLAEGMSKFRAWYYYWGVRIGGGAALRDRQLPPELTAP